MCPERYSPAELAPLARAPHQRRTGAGRPSAGSPRSPSRRAASRCSRTPAGSSSSARVRLDGVGELQQRPLPFARRRPAPGLEGAGRGGPVCGVDVGGRRRRGRWRRPGRWRGRRRRCGRRTRPHRRSHRRRSCGAHGGCRSTRILRPGLAVVMDCSPQRRSISKPSASSLRISSLRTAGMTESSVPGLPFPTGRATIGDHEPPRGARAGPGLRPPRRPATGPRRCVEGNRRAAAAATAAGPFVTIAQVRSDCPKRPSGSACRSSSTPTSCRSSPSPTPSRSGSRRQAMVGVRVAGGDVAAGRRGALRPPRGVLRRHHRRQASTCSSRWSARTTTICSSSS